MKEEIKNKIEELEDLQGEIDSLEKVLSEKKEHLKSVNSQLVTFLGEAGLGQVTTNRGDVLTVKTALNISQKNKKLVAAWLENVGYSEAVKVALEFEKGADISAIEKTAGALDLPYMKLEEVNTNTLKSIVKRIWEDEGYLPGDDSGMEVSTFTYCDIKRKKD